MSTWASILLVAQRDFRERITSRAFQLSTGITVLFIVAWILVPTFLGGDDIKQWSIGVVGDTPPGLTVAVDTASGGAASTDTISFGSRPDAEAALEAGDIDIAVDTQGAIVVDGDTEDQLTTAVVTAMASIEIAARADELGIEVTELADLFTGGYEVESVTGEEEPDEANRIFAFFATVILFMSIVTYGSWILIGVIEEKTNRVVEVVLGTVRPHQLLAGKVLGIGVLGVAQVVLIGVVAITVMTIQDAFEMPAAAGSVLAWAFVWYILGFSFYAVAYAAAGSLVSRQEEAQNAAFPLTMMLMAAYFIASFSITGENTILRISSLLPMFAPMTMPLRIAGGDALAWEIAVSLFLMVIATYGLIRFAGRVYAGGILQSGGRVKW
ncbi:MAG: ABC transporter permease, partial [Acidimicrobiia bacterium]|nr:ABC transporter permease [Acidimicrobiia bacterium]MDX2466728.1 ABC transporter permease [Acidimicrobiia bacterium]